MLPPFALEEPMSVHEASALLGRYGEAAHLYAGGTELLLAMADCESSTMSFNANDSDGLKVVPLVPLVWKTAP